MGLARRRLIGVVAVSVVALSLTATGAAIARVALNGASAREIGAVALAQWFDPSLGLNPRASRPVSALRCGSRTGGVVRCRFHYAPGNTLYKGSLKVSWMRRIPNNGIRARVTATGTSIRLPPAKHFRRSGTFSVLF